MFVYNRVDNTRRTLEALMANTLAGETDVFVFSDGGKDKKSWRRVLDVRAYLHRLSDETAQNHRLRSLTIVERPENFYLERNITEGIAEVFENRDRIIVLEDDIVTSPFFLQYMNDAFRLYANEPRVMHVAGFTNLTTPVPSLTGHGSADFYFTPHMSGWGWGTWRDRWQQHFVHYDHETDALRGLSAADRSAIEYGGVFPCLRSLQKRPIPWDICWELAIYRAHGLCLTPATTLVRNIGLMSGTHFRASSLLQHYAFDREPGLRPLPLTRVQPAVNPAAEAAFREAIRDWGIRYTRLGRIVRSVYLRFFKKDKKH